MDEEPLEIPAEVPRLDALIERPPPEPVPYTPQTPAWTWLFVGVGLLLLAVAFVLVRRWQKRRYRRDALRALDALAGEGDYPSLPVLVKRVALETWPREDVAELSGDAWLAFLDASYGGEGFTRGPGRSLPALAYEDTETTPAGTDIPALLDLLRTWIRRHR